jgi:four helix bundle protein
LKDYRQLKVWQRNHQVVLTVYGMTKSFPKEELYGLTSQLRRAAASIPANLAEGCGGDSEPELKRFIDIAHGSAAELDYHLLLASELNYLERSQYEQLSGELSEIKRMLGAFS